MNPDKHISIPTDGEPMTVTFNQVTGCFYVSIDGGVSVAEIDSETLLQALAGMR